MIYLVQDLFPNIHRLLKKMQEALLDTMREQRGPRRSFLQMLNMVSMDSPISSLLLMRSVRQMAAKSPSRSLIRPLLSVILLEPPGAQISWQKLEP